MENSPPVGFNLPPLPKPLQGYPQLETNSVYAPFEHPITEDDSPWQKFQKLLVSPKFGDVLIGLILIVLLVPSTMALASWNAVPGDLTYPWKISLEKSLLFVLKPSQELSGSTQVAITQRRFSEATKMLSSGQAEKGLTNLTDQVMTTSESLKGITSQSVRKELTDKYIADLIKVNNELEKEKLARRSSAGIGGSNQINQPQKSNTNTNTTIAQNTNTNTTNTTTAQNTNTNTTNTANTTNKANTTTAQNTNTNTTNTANTTATDANTTNTANTTATDANTTNTANTTTTQNTNPNTGNTVENTTTGTTNTSTVEDISAGAASNQDFAALPQPAANKTAQALPNITKNEAANVVDANNIDAAQGLIKAAITELVANQKLIVPEKQPEPSAIPVIKEKKVEPSAVPAVVVPKQSAPEPTANQKNNSDLIEKSNKNSYNDKTTDMVRSNSSTSN